MLNSIKIKNEQLLNKKISGGPNKIIIHQIQVNLNKK
jgi:hypothetical protein